MKGAMALPLVKTIKTPNSRRKHRRGNSQILRLARRKPHISARKEMPEILFMRIRLLYFTWSSPKVNVRKMACQMGNYHIATDYAMLMTLLGMDVGKKT
jgi:hypothetical protein